MPSPKFYLYHRGSKTKLNPGLGKQVSFIVFQNFQVNKEGEQFESKTVFDS